ncbi:MAG: hypothetical protein EA342_04525 [Leptolyngbya sp. LCM1.Bin17]|nr:MAG: hypothetical protein EA342_04525 [Leptolyngbya sp. LCM1.Bin17]
MAESIQAPYPSRGHIQGDVAIAPGVALADGALLGAAPGYRLVISAGVCLGADVVIQASHGDIVIEPGVSLGSGVVVVGQGRIGQLACIGANSTVINPAIVATQVVPPQSLLGDPSQPRSVSKSDQNGQNGFLNVGSTSPRVGQPSPANVGNKPPNGTAASFPGTPAGPMPPSAEQALNPAQGNGKSTATPSNPSSPAPNGTDSTPPAPTPDQKLGSYVYGQTQVNRLLDTLFPHRQPLNSASRNGASSEDKP